MTNNEYRLRYEQTDDIVFPSMKGMQRYLAQEKKAWTPFLETLPEKLGDSIDLDTRHRAVSAQKLATPFEKLEDRLGDRSTFDRATLYRTDTVLPPPSESLEGQLILGLFEKDLFEQALGCYLYFITKGTNLSGTNNQVFHRRAKVGQTLIEAAPIVLALPYSKVSTSKITASTRKAETMVQSLTDEVVDAQAKSAAHEKRLEDHLEEQKTKSKRLFDILKRLHQRRERKTKNWFERIAVMTDKKFEDAERRIRLFELKGQQAEEKRIAEFQRLQELFETQLRLKAPVKLWEKREEKHARQSQAAMYKFVFVGLVAIAFGLGAPLLGGNYVAESFFQQVCNIPGVKAAPATQTTAAIPASPAADCERVFSAKGPLTIAGLLVVTSLLMWMTRLQYRIHLSERHLALDASEKMAFAETYLAMKEGNDVGRDNEAIVLASLFRPTQDGIIKDDETAIDLSAAAVLAKSLGKS